jgi:hypothetical protein
MNVSFATFYSFVVKVQNFQTCYTMNELLKKNETVCSFLPTDNMLQEHSENQKMVSKKVSQ